MFPSIFTDELGIDLVEGIPHLKSWELQAVDLRGRVFGKAAESLAPEKLPDLRKLLTDNDMRVGCLQSSLAKVHLPNARRQAAEAEKLEGIIRAADALDCRLVRSFFYWQPPPELEGELAVRPDEQQRVADMFGPLAERAKGAGLVLAFENCGVTPEEVFTMLDLFDVPTWGLAWDVCNSWDSDERRADEDAYIARMVKRALCVHVKAKKAVEGTADELIPYDKVLQLCDNAGVQGSVAAETHNPDRSVSNVEMSRRVVEVIQKAWPTAAPGGRGEKRKSAKGVARPWEREPVGFAVVGLGMGHSRAKQITTTPGTELIGVADLVAERAQRTGEALGVSHTTDFRELLDNEAVEVVMVMTETGNHAEVALQALEAGKHVLTTKPMETSVEKCDAMIRKADDQGRLLAVDFDRRNTVGVLTLKKAVADGAFGKLLAGSFTLKILRAMDYFNANGGWRGTRKLDGGGVLSNQSIHHLDELIYTLGTPARVRANIWTQTHAIEAEDLGSAAWLYDDGLLVTYNATSSYPHATWFYQYELHGDQGAFFEASGGPFDQVLTRWFLEGVWSDKGPEPAEPEWLNSMDNFAAAVRTGVPLSCDGRDGRRSRAVLDAMYRSALEADGAWIDL
ncbi:MAG: Gfo/Idh/MocA family oxidoreductase [Armatimonadetes bacterium]|nr:Gfo/Idh/MocA family oxidoreductase [Armatimonadota bacterium]NDK12016.1 Gfo/Idh/MocA family oxidoreductase [Armatimonadota bacterium]